MKAGTLAERLRLEADAHSDVLASFQP